MRMPCAPWMELSSRSGLEMARLAASIARFVPVAMAVVVLVLGVLQYRWTSEIGGAEQQFAAMAGHGRTGEVRNVAE